MVQFLTDLWRQNPDEFCFNCTRKSNFRGIKTGMYLEYKNSGELFMPENIVVGSITVYTFRMMNEINCNRCIPVHQLQDEHCRK